MTLHDKLADAIGNPRSVHCTTCHRNQPVDSAEALATGWPKCCGYTMTINSHESRCTPLQCGEEKGAPQEAGAWPPGRSGDEKEGLA